MKHLKSIAAVAAIAALSSQVAFADPVEISSELKLVGFSGGSCNISVNANANATSLDLDNPQPHLDVATVNTQCDYNYSLTVSADTDEFDNFALTHTQDEFVSVPYVLDVDGFLVGQNAPIGLDNIVFSELPGISRQVPVRIDVGGPASLAGIYQGNVTFTMIVD